MKLDLNGGQCSVRLSCPQIWEEAGGMVHICPLMVGASGRRVNWPISALDLLPRRVPGHPPSLPLGRRTLPGPPDASAAASRVLICASHVRACATLHRLRALCRGYALYAALPPGHARLGRHRLQVVGARRGGSGADVARRSRVGGA